MYKQSLSTILNQCKVIIVILLCAPLLTGCEESSKLKQRANAPVFKKLNKGVNVDTSLPSTGVWSKLQHDAAHFESVAKAGFESVRIFMPYRAGIEEVEQQIKDALANDLAIVICMWGDGSWAQNDIEIGAAQIAEKWVALAKAWKAYPSDLVFEILNEPKGIGYKDEETYVDVMKLYNAAAQAIRDEDPDRPILIGSPRSNDPEYLENYVTKEHLTYTFDGGKGFYEDTNAGVAIHFYNPRHEDGINFAMWLTPLPEEDEKWKPTILIKLTLADAWRKSIGVNIPIITTEWGLWSFTGRPDEEVTKWLDYHMENFKKYDIGNMWYTGIQNNQRSFGIFDSEFGWNQNILDKLTGVKPTSLPKTSQTIDSEFLQPGFSWQLTSEKIIKEYIYGMDAFSGNSMLKVTVPKNVKGQLYQESYHADGEYKGAPGRSLLHLKQGETYRISFIGASENGNGRLKIGLKDVEGLATIYDSSEKEGSWILIDQTPKTYTVLYTHNSATVMDVRLEFDFGAKEQVLYLDKVVFIRE